MAPCVAGMRTTHRILTVALLFPVIIALAGAGPSPADCKLNKPSAAQCGVRGSIKFPYDYQYPANELASAGSLKECALLCARRAFSYTRGQPEKSAYLPAYCRSFGYDEKNGVCQLGVFNVTHAVEESASGRQSYYDVGCFDCGDLFCGFPLGEEILDNPSFEDPLIGPWDVVDSTLISGRRGSGQALQMRVSEASGPVELIQRTNGCNGAFYEWSIDYKITFPAAVDEDFFVSGQMGEGTSYRMYPVRNFTNGVWRTARGFGARRPGFEAEIDGKYFSFYADHEVPGTVYVAVDNAHVARVRFPFRSRPNAKQMLKNGGFESGAFGPWTYGEQRTGKAQGSYEIVSPGVGSKYAVKIRPTRKSFDDEHELRQHVAVRPGATYLLSADIVQAKGRDSYHSTLGIRSPLGDASYSQPFPASGNGTVSFPFYAPSDRMTVVVSAFFDNFDKPSQAIFDNIVLKEYLEG